MMAEPQARLVQQSAPRESRRACLQRLGLAALGCSAAAAHCQDDLGDLYVADEIDRAVSRGVDYLVDLQDERGIIADRGHELAMTSLAIMAMAALGTQPNPFSDRGRAMSRALDFVLQKRNQEEDGYFGNRDGSRMYGHGITTLMLTEVLGMGATVEQNERIHQRLAPALKLILAAQAVSKPQLLIGGWRYSPDARDSDLSVSVWQLMALRSAKNDGLDIPGEAIAKALEYLHHSYSSPLTPEGLPREEIGGFVYTPGQRTPTFAMTAAGLLAMQVCGRYDSPLVSGAARWLLANPPQISETWFYYGIYYYAQGMHQAGGEYAEAALQLVPELLLDAQRATGSWLGGNQNETKHGTVYATSLAILSLSVRYHYLPIYQR